MLVVTVRIWLRSGPVSASLKALPRGSATAAGHAQS
jgi:hypothetical protein